LVYTISSLRHDNSMPFPPPDSAVNQLVTCFQDLSLQELLLGVIPKIVRETIDGLEALTREEMEIVLPDLARLTLMEWHQPDGGGVGGQAGETGEKGKSESGWGPTKVDILRMGGYRYRITDDGVEIM
jgi:hypothetical protein